MRRVVLCTFMLCMSLGLSACSKHGVTSYDTKSEKGSCEFLLDITKSNLAPESSDDFKNAYESSAELFATDTEHNEFFNYDEKVKNLVTTLEVVSESVVYSAENNLGDTSYRVTLEIKSADQAETVDVYFYINEDGKIDNSLILIGGTDRI